jgi:hypothetical protein
MMANPRKIDLIFQMTKYPGPNIYDGSRLTCTATNSIGFTDNNIFRYERIPGVPPTVPDNDVLNGVCSPADLEELPVGAPNPTSQQPTFFRKDALDIVFRSSAIGDQAALDIQEDVKRLVMALNYLDDLQAPTTITVGPF